MHLSWYYTLILMLFEVPIIKGSYSQCPHVKEKIVNSSELIKGRNSSNTHNVILEQFVTKINHELIYGRIAYIRNPQSTLTMLQPKNDNEGCLKNITSKTSYTAAMADNCEIATNAGFFKVNSGACIGNLINNGKIYLNSGGIQNANFGIKNDDSLFFGYLSAEEVKSGNFKLLVSGVIWLLRNNQSVVNHSIAHECDESQDTGTLEDFASVRSARTAVGATANGTVVLVHVEGKTTNGGINLRNLAKLLSRFGVVSAINLDGGGSATLVVNGTLVSYPSDACNIFTCERPVSTVLCVKATCPPHSKCIKGFSSKGSKSVLPSFLALIIILGLIGLSILIISLVLVTGYCVKQRKKQHWSKFNARLVFSNDDYVHFDAQPLMNNVDDIEEI